MASGTIVFIPPNGGNVIQGSQGGPGTFVQAPGMVQYVQYGGNPPQQNPQVGAMEDFRKAEPKTLGAIQILIGLIHIGFSSVSAVISGTNYVVLVTISGYPFWGAIFFIASGSLSVSAEKHPTSGLVKCSVGMNITSAVMSFIGIILYIVELAINPVDYLHGYYWTTSVGTGLSVLLLFFSMLEFCIAVSTAHFGCQAACCKNDQQEVVFVPYTVNGGNVVPTEGIPASPPPYEPVNVIHK
ncbi:membrane-spanning 4-domains subfamily A member 8-like [Elgaria multicarinata webbii]|uniref:membrane-spanning 4-domains subfamily A member 8-like n=1 Tax=Elgaria multicarinata webbii TaxID=159646 RepID=UPI002FCCFBE5